MIDPCVFIDDDNRAYMYYGGGCKCEMGELNDDMISVKGKMKPIDTLYDFHEAPWVFKRYGVYYLIYSDGTPWGANQIHYATSCHPLGPWKYCGIFMQPVGCETTHGSVVEYKDKWYMFYHNTDLSRTDNLRSLCVDELNFTPDGSISMLIQTKNGVPPIESYRNDNQNPIAVYLFNVNKDGIEYQGGKIESDSRSDFKMVLSKMEGKESWLDIPSFYAKQTGRYTIGLLYGTDQKLSKCRIFIDDNDYSLINLPITGNMRNYTGYSYITLPMAAGEHKIHIRMEQGRINAESVIVKMI